MHGTTVYLQRWIVDQFETNRKIVVDHRDHNTLDNRKQNLRVTYITNNNRNRNGKNKNNKSGYRNVFWSSNENCWIVLLGDIFINSEEISLKKLIDILKQHNEHSQGGTYGVEYVIVYTNLVEAALFDFIAWIKENEKKFNCKQVIVTCK